MVHDSVAIPPRSEGGGIRVKSRFRSFQLALLSVMVVVSLILTGCGTPEPTQVQEATQAPEATSAPTATPVPELGRDPKTLIVGIYGNPSDFDPASNNEQLGNLILDATSEGLVRAKAGNLEAFEPQLAERWEHNDDYTVWTFYLRQDARFHDGTPVDAEAVKASFTRLVDSGLGMSFVLSMFIGDPGSQMVVKDAYTLEFNFESPTPLLAKALSSGYGCYVVSPKAVQEHDKDGDLAHEWLQNNEAGSGPYTLTELSPNQQAVLTRFDDWWGWEEGGWYFDKIILKIIPEEASRRSLIETGDIDVALDFGVENLEAMQKNADLVVELSEGLALQYIVLGDYGPLADPRVRQAISYAFDYEGYVNGIWKGLAPRAKGPFPYKLQCHDPDVFLYDTDLEKAKQLLEEAGVEEGLEIRYMTSGEASEVGQILQAQLAQIGVTLKIEQREISSYIGTFYGNVEWPERPEIMAYTWWPDYNDPTDWAWVLFHTDASGSSGANAGFYSNERADEIMDEALGVLDEEELCQMYQEFQNIVTQQDPAWIPLVEPPDVAVLRQGIDGYQNHPLYRGTFDFDRMSRSGY